MPAETESLITITNPMSPISEAYRSLRTSIQFASFDNPVHTIAVTSTGSEEGKTTTLANLAVTFSETGNRVILVDADLRRPTLHKRFGLSNEIGLTSAFIKGQTERPTLNLQETTIPNLRVLTSGPLPPNPSALLGSSQMRKVIEALREEAEYVLFDCPPILAVTDAAILGHQVDGVLLVVSAYSTKRDHAIKAKAILEKVNANILGVVLNNAKLDTSVYQYYAQR